jgi:hypothetical protein
LFTISDTTSGSDLEKKELYQRNFIPVIVIIYRKRAKTNGVGGEEERTNPYKNCTSSQQEL